VHTPPLQSRIVAAVLAVGSLVLLAVHVFVYVNLRVSLEDNLDDVLAQRAAIAQRFALRAADTDLVADLTEAGIPALIVTTDGREFESDPLSDRTGTNVPDAVPGPYVSRTDPLPDGAEVTVYASRRGVDDTLRRLVLLQIAASVIALATATILIGVVTRRALAPLKEVARTAERTAAGHGGERLRPDRPDSELGRMATAFDEMLDSLEAAMAAREAASARTRQFLDDAAHQLRTPIASIRASVDALEYETDPDQRRRLTDILIRETGRAGRLVTGLLRVARLDEDAPLAPTPTDLVALCRHEIDRIAALAPHLTIDIDTGGHDAVAADLDIEVVREALANILDNARRHARSRITVTVTPPATIVVTDDGPGVPAEHREQVFDRFVSLDRHGGSGLGLAIARTLARLHGGDLHVSDEGFVLRLGDAAAA
jgi:two-component system, OmpR family, sensor kinase